MKTKQLIFIIFLIFITPNSWANTITNPIIQISTGGDFTLALKKDGTIWAWGKNNYGQLGDGTTTNQSIPIQISINNVQFIDAGREHSLALKKDSTVWAWGYNKSGMLGDGTITAKSTPVLITGIENVKLISAGKGHGGYSHSLALKVDGTVFAWGHNYNGQLGDGTIANKSIPVQVEIDNVKSISAGYNHSIALKEDGTVWAWGDNNCGELGDGTTTDKRTPVQVEGIYNIKSISAGDDHSLALKEDGTVWAWGFGKNGQLGDGTGRNQFTPVQVTEFDNAKLISAGFQHSLALKKDGTVWAWGSNGVGQLGLENTSNKTTPVYIGLENVKSLSKGFYSNFALNEEGVLWGWGRNNYDCIDYHYQTTIKTPSLIMSMNPIFVSIITHPSLEKWFISNTIEIEVFETIIPYGFYYNIDNKSDTQTLITNSTYESISRTTISESIALTHGAHYFHFSPSNSDYWPTQTLHFKYNHFNQQLIAESETHPDPNQFYPLPDISININNLEPGIIIRYVVDQNSDTIPNFSSLSKESEAFSLNVRSPGTYYLHVRAEDSLGNIAIEELTTHFKFNLSTQPITSTTHSIATEWSTNKNVQIEIAGWKTGMKYHYLLDNQPDGIPIESSNIISSGNSTIHIPFPGTHYIHVRVIDPQGNIFPEDSTSHFRVNIFPTLPKIESSTHPNQNEWYTLPNIAIEFIHTTDNINLRYIVNEQPGTIPDDSASLKSSKSFVLPGQSPGTHYIHIRAKHTDGTLDPAYLTAHFRYNLLASGESPPTALPKIDNLSVTPTIVSNSESITIQADVIIDK